MSEKHRYTAIKDGYLGDRDGYGRVAEGETVVLSEPIECSWLVPADQAPKGPKEFHLPKVNFTQEKDLKLPENPTISDPAYENQIKSLEAIEAQREAVETGQPVPPSGPELIATNGQTIAEPAKADGETETAGSETGGDAAEGTGNQDVI